MAQADDIVSLVSLFALAITTVLLARNRVEVLVSKRQHETKRYDNPFEIRALIEAKELPEWGPNKLEGLEARSLSNEHLQRMFGIENAFTTVDKRYANGFIRRSKDLINISAGDWHSIGHASEIALWRWKEEARTGCKDKNFRVELQPLIQALTLFAVLRTFFFLENEDELQAVQSDAFTSLAEAIDTTWMMSKFENPVVGFKDNEPLRNALKNILPLTDMENPRENPLNFILPGFETMWRVVLRGFIEVAFRTGKEHETWREVLIQYSQDPTSEKFNTIHTPDDVSASHLVKETLRLYPPTKRVYREWKNENSVESTTLAADIQACHHSTNIWGRTAKKFDPLRWQEVTKEQEAALLAFGSKPFECPAKPTFGPRLVGLLIGILLYELPNDCKLLSEIGEMKFGPGMLSNDRSGWEHAFLLVPNRPSGL